MGGGDVYCDFFGGAPHYRARPPKLVLEASGKWDWSGLCPFPPKKMTGRGQRGGTYCGWGGGLNTVVAEMITELIRFEPEICICNGK